MLAGTPTRTATFGNSSRPYERDGSPSTTSAAG
jgi:hypothetical protein